MPTAAALRDRGHGGNISYSRKVFIPLTQLCRDVCHYCTFAQPPRRAAAAYLSPDEVLAIAPRRRARRLPRGAVHARRQAGAALRRGARGAGRGSATPPRSTISPRWRRWCSSETGLLPHLNPGVMSRDDIARAAPGLGVAGHHAGDARRSGWRSAAGRISARPTRCPPVRLATIAAAGEAAVPFTTGILIGIGETRRRAHRGAAGAARPARAPRPHPGNHHPEFPRQAGHAHGGRARAGRSTIICGPSRSARLIFGPAMNIQAPPNLSAGALGRADRGRHQRLGRRLAGDARPRQSRKRRGRSSTRWPQQTAQAGKVLVERLAIYPGYVARRRALARPGAAHARCCARADADGLARATTTGSPARDRADRRASSRDRRRAAATATRRLELAASSTAPARATSSTRAEIVRAVRGARRRLRARSATAADALRARRSAATRVTYVVNRNINYTNICYFRCRFCAFSKGKLRANLRGRPYDLDLDEIARRVARGLGARRHRSLHAGRHPSRLHRRDLSRDLPRRQGGRAGHAHPRLLAAGGHARRARRSGCRSRRFSRELQGGRARHACRAPRPRSSTTRSAPMICPDKLTTDAMARGDARPRTRSGCAPPRRSCSAMSTGPSIGRGICCASATCRSAPAASPNSCRCRSCHMEAPIYLQGPRAQRPDLPRGGADACGRRGWRCIRSSPTSRPPG